MSIFIDLTGRTYGKLTVIQLYCGGHGLHLQWECLCDCGKKCVVVGSKLKNGHTQSCGCLKYKGHRFSDLTGMKFNTLTVTSIYSRNKIVVWNCLCDCGKETKVRSSNLKNGSVKSCGCLRYATKNTTHGLTNTRLFTIWDNMKARCYNHQCDSYKNYGGKGIEICHEWLNSFQSFYDWAIKNGYKDDLTIERIKITGNYEPSNCKWIPQNEQARNKSTSLGIEMVKEIKSKLNLGVSCKSLSQEYNVSSTAISNIKRGKAYQYIN